MQITYYYYKIYLYSVFNLYIKTPSITICLPKLARDT